MSTVYHRINKIEYQPGSTFCISDEVWQFLFGNDTYPSNFNGSPVAVEVNAIRLAALLVMSGSITPERLTEQYREGLQAVLSDHDGIPVFAALGELKERPELAEALLADMLFAMGHGDTHLIYKVI